MKGLKRIILINSGNFPYADVNISDTSHFSGINGAGKSTLLRTLVFFYTANKSGLDLDPGKESFDSYYFKNSNSYIVYEVERERPLTNYCILLHVKNKYLQFDFINAPYNEKWFRESKETVVYNYDIVISNIRKSEIKINKVETLKEYIATLYGDKTFGLSSEMNKYALFSASGKTMIPQILENIFLNNDIEKGFLKTVFLHTTGEGSSMPALSLDSYRGNLKNYTNQKHDIEFWKSESTTEKINVLIGNLQKHTDARLQIEGLLGNVKYLVSKVTNEKDSLENKLQLREDDKKKKEEELGEIINKWKEQKEDLKYKIRKIQEDLKTIDEYKIKWEDFDYKDAENKVSQIDYINKEIIDNERAIARFEDGKSAILDKFDNLKRMKKDSFSQKKSLIKEQFFNKKRNINESVRQERFQYEALVEKIDKDKTDLINKFRPLCNQKHNELYNLTLKRGELKNFNPLKKEIDELKDKEKQLMSKVKDIEIQIKELNIKLSLIPGNSANEIREIKDGQNHNLLSVDNELKELDSKKEQIKIKISKFEGSFMDWLENNKPDWRNNIGKVVREDDVLFSKDLSPELGDDSSLLFGVRVNTETLKCNAMPVDKMKDELKNIEIQIEQIIRKKIDIHSYIDNEIKVIEKKYKKEKSSLNSSLDEKKSELDFVRGDISETRKQIDDLEKKGLEQKQLLIEDADLKIKNTKCEIDNYEDMLSQNEKEYISKKDDLLKKYKVNCAALEKQLSELDANENIEIEKANREMEAAIKKIDEDSQIALRENGVNPDIVNKLQRDKENKKKQLVQLRELERKLINFSDDKEKYLSKESSYKESLNDAKKSLAYYERTYIIDEKKVKAEINSISKEIENISATMKEFKSILDEHNSLMKDSRFDKLYSVIVNEDDDVTMFATQKSISDIISALTNNDTIKCKSIKEICEIVDYIRGRNGLCLDERNTFYLEPARPSNDSEFIKFAKGVEDFQKNNLINNFTKVADKIYKAVILSINQDFNSLKRQRDKIQKMITSINNSIEKMDFSSVIKKIEIKMVNTNAKVWDTLEQVYQFGQNYNNELSGGLFSCNKDSSFNKAADKLIANICNIMEGYKENSDIDLGGLINILVDTYEGANEYKNQESVKNSGSNGTSTTIKFLINLMMLNYARSQDTNRRNNVAIHCILDETSTLDPDNTKGIISLAKNLDILTLHASPNTSTPESYSNLFCLVNDSKSNHRIKQVKLLL